MSLEKHLGFSNYFHIFNKSQLWLDDMFTSKSFNSLYRFCYISTTLSLHKPIPRSITCTPKTVCHCFYAQPSTHTEWFAFMRPGQQMFVVTKKVFQLIFASRWKLVSLWEIVKTRVFVVPSVITNAIMSNHPSHLHFACQKRNASSFPLDGGKKITKETRVYLHAI